MQHKKFDSDIDIDFANRDQILRLIKHIPASMMRDDKLARHATGVYFTEIPQDPFSGMASLDYNTAEQRGYVKLDFLNVNVYGLVRDPQHLDHLMQQEPPWDRLYDPEFCAQLIHIGGHYDTLIKMPEAVNSITRMAMFLSVIRPAKRHLIGRHWSEVAATVWQRPEDDSYYFKRAHAVSYSQLVAVHMNLLVEGAVPSQINVQL